MKKKKSKKITKKRFKKELKNVFAYFLGGGVWFWAGYVLIVTLDGPLIDQFGEEVGLFIANFIGNSVGFSLNYIVLRIWKFNTKKSTSFGSTTVKYYVYTVLNVFGLNYLILYGLKKVGIEPEFGQFIASGFFTFWNYFWYKYYVFKDEKKHPVHKKKRKHHWHHP